MPLANGFIRPLGDNYLSYLVAVKQQYGLKHLHLTVSAWDVGCPQPPYERLTMEQFGICPSHGLPYDGAPIAPAPRWL